MKPLEISEVKEIKNFSYGDITKEELIEAMKLLLEDHALREKIAKEGQIYVKTNYNWEKSTEKLRGFLEH